MHEPGHDTPQPDDRVPARDRRPAGGPQDRAGRARRRRRVRARDRPGQEADRRRDRADAGLQRLSPGPDAEGPAGRDDHRAASRTTATSRRPCTGTACGSRTATTARTTRRRRSRSARASPTRCTCPTPARFWYHPHIREDYGQEMGLYGNILVTPSEPDYWPPANRELLLTLDDILIEDGQIAAFQRVGDDARGDGPVRQRDARRRRARPRARSASAARSSASTSPTPPTRASST